MVVKFLVVRKSKVIIEFGALAKEIRSSKMHSFCKIVRWK